MAITYVREKRGSIIAKEAETPRVFVRVFLVRTDSDKLVRVTVPTVARVQ